MGECESLEAVSLRMREDWDRRARESAEHFIYTRDSESDECDFAASGEASYNQLVRPFLPLLLEGRAASRATVVEIGCGVGRMTVPFARDFARVHAVDVSPAMVDEARRRLAGSGNIAVHLGSGHDLAFLPDACCDLAFSFIVFQHIPLAPVIENYIREAARVLKPGGAFKFQLNGDQSPGYLAHERDTWLGETFSENEAAAMLGRAGLSLESAEGAGTQYFILTARKAEPVPARNPRPYILPGEPWAAAQLLSGWGDGVDASWRPMLPRAEAILSGGGSSFYLSLYFWPADPFVPPRIRVESGGLPIGEALPAAPGDWFFEFPVPPAGISGESIPITITLDPPPTRAPAFRVMGFYTPS
jgi:SAM-dependent methyltransferase